MLKSCKYCGGIHDRTHTCSSKPVRVKDRTYIDKFRSTSLWKKKSIEIRDRDNHLCQVCIRNIYNTVRQYTFDTLGVHHIHPLNSDWAKRLDNANLLTVCEYHHKMCDSFTIPIDVQVGIVMEQEAKASGNWR